MLDTDTSNQHDLATNEVKSGSEVKVDTFATGEHNFSVLNSKMEIGTLEGSGGFFFIDPAYVKIANVLYGDEEALPKAVIIGDRSVLNYATDDETLIKYMTEAGIGFDQESMTLTDSTASVLVLGNALNLGSVGRVILDGTLTSAASAIAKYSEDTNAAVFTNNSLLVVSGDIAENTDNSTGALYTTHSTTRTVQILDGAKL